MYKFAEICLSFDYYSYLCKCIVAAANVSDEGCGADIMDIGVF